MLSIIVYGRNDSHGYNMHKRVSISLNCMAEMLNMENDEIIFVDWNSKDSLPSLIEDISDTLTSKCLSLLKVIRVRESQHKALAPSDLKRPTIEPFARNIAIRNANSQNHWLLSTNTDMIFMSNENKTLSELVQSLPDAYYQSYRFELPEFIWSTFDRFDPISCLLNSKKWIRETHLGKRINLEIDGIKAADAPGDFQLAPIKHWKEIKGFPENLLSGWGVDGAVIANLTKAAGQAHYLPESQLIAAHCNHLRELTHFHDPSLPSNKEDSQRHSNDTNWGVASTTFEEIDVQGKSSRAAKFFKLITKNYPTSSLVEIDLMSLHQSNSYPLFPTLHFIFDSLEVNSQKKKIIYLGFSRIFRQALSEVAKEFQIEFSAPGIEASELDLNYWEKRLGDFQESLLIIDFGYEESELLTEIALESLARLALLLPQLADHMRKSGNQNQVSFIRAVSWALRETVIGDFETPLFNNYGMVLTGRPRENSLLHGFNAVPIKLAIKFGIWSTYNIDYISDPGRMRSMNFRRLVKLAPPPLKRFVYLVVYGIARRFK